jgi:hypothetical protein
MIELLIMRKRNQKYDTKYDTIILPVTFRSSLLESMFGAAT